jgi:hypothetical protein
MGREKFRRWKIKPDKEIVNTADSMSIEILKDGTLKITTDEISGPNHVGAEALLREIISLSGGKADKKHRHTFSAFGLKVSHEHKH